MPNDRTNLSIDTYQLSRPVAAYCKKCGERFRATPNMTPEEAKNSIDADFDAHNCKKQDGNQSATRGGREATESQQ